MFHKENKRVSHQNKSEAQKHNNSRKRGEKVREKVVYYFKILNNINLFIFNCVLGNCVLLVVVSFR